jgi:hypothetical protein
MKASMAIGPKIMAYQGLKYRQSTTSHTIPHPT